MRCSCLRSLGIKFFESASERSRRVLSACHALLQAYVVPDYFRDDWLNDYHDMCRAARSAAGTVAHTRASFRGVAAACNARGSGGVDSEITPQAPTLAPSRLADSDYRFVYLGPKVNMGSSWAFHASYHASPA